MFTHAHMHTYTDAHTHTYSIYCLHRNIYSLNLLPHNKYQHILICIHTHTLTLSLSDTHTQTHTHTNTNQTSIKHTQKQYTLISKQTHFVTTQFCVCVCVCACVSVCVCVCVNTSLRWGVRRFLWGTR